jgi:photosystem II stability/assembly factor-like uncharacterized protein
MSYRKRAGIIAIFSVLGLAGCTPAATVPSPTATATVSPIATSSPAPTPPPPTPAPTGAIPSNFNPEAMTAISHSDYWVLGSTGCTSGTCTSAILQTTNAGATFQPIAVPAATSASEYNLDIRFANASDGWVYGNQLWSTHDGGATWQRIETAFTDVLQLEPGAKGNVYAVFQTCTSSISTSCTSALMRSQASTDTWTRVVPPGNPLTTPVFGVHGDMLWVMYFDRSTRLAYTGYNDATLWYFGSMPCEPDLDGNYDPVSNSVVWAFCATGTQGNPWVSTSGGDGFLRSPSLFGFGNGGMMAATSSERAFVVGPGIDSALTTNGGQTFVAAPQLTGAVWAGFTDSEVGFAVIVHATGTNTLLRTIDAGATWSPVDFS